MKASWRTFSFGMVLVCSSGIIGCPIPTTSHAPFTDKKQMGGQLEPIFQRFMNLCKVQVPLINEDRKVSAIPSDIFNEQIRLQTTTDSVDRQDASLVFRFVFEANGLNLSGIDNASSRRFLNISFGNRNYPLPTPGVSTRTFSYSCARVLKAALDAKVEVPQASLKTAIQGDTETASEIIMVTGRFDSPLNRLLNSEEPYRLYTHLAFWQLYRDSEIAPASAYYLDHFTGAAVYRTAGIKRSTKIDVDGSASLSFGPVSTNERASVKLESSSEVSVQDFSTIVETPSNPADYYSSAPTATQIIGLFQSAAANAVSGPSGDDDKLRQSVVYSHWRAIRGVPTALCNQAWRLKYNSEKLPLDNPKLFVSSSNDSNGVPICTFKISGIPRAGNFQPDSSGTVNLEYDIEEDTPQRIDNMVLSISINKRVDTTRHPTFWDGSALPGVNPEKTLFWDFLIRYSDSASAVDKSKKVDLSTTEVVCPGGKRLVKVENVDFQKDDNAVRIRLLSEQRESGEGVELDKLESCDMTANINVAVKSGDTVSRAVRATIKWPRPKSPQSSTIVVNN